MSTTNTSMAVEINDLHAWYGESHILHGVNMQVEKGASRHSTWT
jgi:branched-chain amino acid transport system ATP-binding protein